MVNFVEMVSSLSWTETYDWLDVLCILFANAE